MNQRTSKLLQRYASKSDRTNKELKKWWNNLSWKEKASEREKMLESIGK